MADVPDDRIATAFIFPMRIAGADGIVAACSTKSSHHQLSQLHDCQDSMDVAPAWLFFECFFFRGMTLLNWSGMKDPSYAQSSRSIGLLGDLLVRHCQPRSIDDWSAFSPTRGGPYLKGLRDLLGRLGVQVWLELVSRSSRLVSQALDVSVRIIAGTYVESQAAQYLLWQRWVPTGSALAYNEQWVPQPWDWYQFPVWQSMGQQPVHSEFIVDASDPV